MRAWLCVLLCMAWPAAAQTIHKCADGRGGHAYQSLPCEGEVLRSWAVEVRDAPAAPVARAATSRSTRPPASERAPWQAVLRRNRSTSRDNQYARCLAARASREQTLRKLGSQRRYEDLRRLNERVSAVCNHRGRN